MDAQLKAIEEYAAECSIIKVALSEYCDFVADEMVQIYGGYGYSADYPAERAYRDSRINRIFEGTNEINRMLIPGRLMKSALSGNLALLPAAQALMDEMLSPQMAWFRRRRQLAGGRTEAGTEREEGGADDARHGRAEVHDEARRPAGDSDGHRRHHHGRVRDGVGDPARAEAGGVAGRRAPRRVTST